VLPDWFCQVRMACVQDSVVPSAAIAVAAGIIRGDKSVPRPRCDRTYLSSNDPQRLRFNADTPQVGGPHPELGGEIVAHLPKDLPARNNAKCTKSIAKRSASMRCLLRKYSAPQPVASIRG
jgi:hypothetical protein